MRSHQAYVVDAQELMKEHEETLQSTVDDYKAQLSAAASKHSDEIAEVEKTARAAAAEAKAAREEAESRVADLEVMLEDHRAQIEKLHAEVKQHEMEKAVKDAAGGTLVECVFSDPGSLGIGAKCISTEAA
jgi:predicted RNase H-like nuclease (RuvC/YqgF family)